MSGNRIEPAPPGASEEARALEARILQARGRITGLYRILMNSPAVCDGWEQLLTAIRQRTSLSPRLRELVILRVAVLNRADYEFSAHVPFGREAGLTDAEMSVLRDDDLSVLTELDRVVLAYTDAMTRDVQVPDELFARVKASFDATGLVDLTATIAAYNMVSRFLAALDVH
ncbi:MAG: carboxymuconolactone decarboxylase family protein [Rhizomicrobium sp.]